MRREVSLKIEELAEIISKSADKEGEAEVTASFDFLEFLPGQGRRIRRTYNFEDKTAVEDAVYDTDREAHEEETVSGLKENLYYHLSPRKIQEVSHKDNQIVMKVLKQS